MSYLSEVSEGGFWLKSWLIISDYDNDHDGDDVDVDGRDVDDNDVDDHDGDDGDDDWIDGRDGNDNGLFEWSGWLRLLIKILINDQWLWWWCWWCWLWW